MTRLLTPRSTAALVFGGLVLAVAGGGWAYAAGRGGGTITVCVQRLGGQLYKAAHCASGDRQLSWNVEGPRGLRGRRGLQGAQGLQGVQGPAGPGIQFTTASGSNPPTITEAGTYFVDARVFISNKPTEPESGLCAVEAFDPQPPGDPAGPYRVDEFDGAYVQPPGPALGSEGEPWDGDFSFSGVLTVPAAALPAKVGLLCADARGDGPTISAPEWWIARVGP